MRLIDADALIDFIDLGHFRHPDDLCYSELDVVNMLNHAPVAFNLEEVIKTLKDHKYHHAAEIVKEALIND